MTLSCSCRRLTLPVTVFGDRLYELISKALHVWLASRDESRSKLKLACSRNLISSRHNAGRREKFDTGSAGSDSLAVLISFNQKVSDIGFAFERLHAGLSIGNIESVEQD